MWGKEVQAFSFQNASINQTKRHRERKTTDV